MFALLSSGPVLAEKELAVRARWSAKTAPLYIGRLRRSGWLSERAGLLVCTPILQARQAVIDEIGAGTRPLFD